MKMTPITALVAVLSFSAQAESEMGGADLLREADRAAPDPAASPVRRIQRQPTADAPATPPPDGFRRIDGRGNNPQRPEMGASGTLLRRWAAADYADGLSQPAGQLRRGAREISNIMAAQDRDIPNRVGASDYLWQWGQFLDHDIDLTDGADPAEPWPIPVPTGDPWFDPNATGQVEMAFNRSLYAPDSGVDSARQQINEITGWIDASNVYGSDIERATALRENDGSGRLKTSDGNLLPFNTLGLANAGGGSELLFVAGDVRANEQIGLTVMHTLFVREHNRLADELAAQNPQLSGNEIYQRARRLVGAMMQAITYNEYLPVLLGPGALPDYRGYDPDLDAGIANLFSTASYRYGHSTLSPNLLRLDARGNEVPQGHLPLRDAFFSPAAIAEVGGIEPYLRGLAAQACQAVDPYVVDGVRNFLFGEPGSGGFDLASLNIQRGRDHGLPGYNQARQAMGLGRRGALREISSDPEIRGRLAAAYTDVDDVDPWVGGLAEDALPGAMVGELIHAVLVRQFRVLRDGDRFWYQRVLSPQEVQFVNESRLAHIIRRNSRIGNEVQDDVFHLPRRQPRT